MAAVFVAFLPALSAGFVSWDDPLNLTDNPAYRGLSADRLAWMFTTTHGGQYKPLTWVSFALDHALWGMNPTGYHLTNLVLHAANAVGCWLLIRALLGAEASGAAAIGALFFALHPLRVEAVAWASARRDVLSGLFYLATLLAYVRVPSARGRGRAGWLLVSLVSFALGLLAKPSGMALPVVLLVLDVYPLRRLRREPRARLLLEKTPYVVLSLVAAAVSFAAAQPVEGMRTLEQHGVAARVAQAAYGVCFYLWKTLVPLGLSPLYVLELRLDPTRGRYVAAVLAVLGVSVALVLLRRRVPWALAAWVSWVALLSPVLGLVQTGPQIAADRFTYLPSLSWAVLVAAGAARAGRRALVPAAIALAALGVLAFRQTAVWKDGGTLWEHALRVDPDNYVAHLNLGAARTDDRQAIADFSAVLRVRPGIAMAWYDRGNRRRAVGDLDGAIADLSEAIRLAPRNPKAWHNRGFCRQTKGDWAGAADDYERALAVAPPGWPGRAQIAGNLAAVRARLR